jgi:hypothetical protein
MSLSCSCDYDYDYDPGQWVYWFDNTLDFEPLDTTKRRRCCSCNKLIDIGSLCVKYGRARYPWNEIEARIVGDTFFEMNGEPPIKIADHYHCERCGEIYLNLVDIGYECLMPNEDMKESLKEYQALIGFKKDKF